MGNGQSVLPPAPPPPGPPQPVITLPLQRSPVQDGASGLHYSGRIYQNQFIALGGADTCPSTTITPDHINDIMPNSISTTTLTVDESTKRISVEALTAYITNAQNSGLIPGTYDTIDAQMAADKSFYTAVRGEYCFYEARYRAALVQFLNLVAQPGGVDQATVTTALNSAIALNQRLNSLLEIINYVGNDRATRVGQRDAQLDAANKALNANIDVLSKQYTVLSSSDARLQTQSEMIRYTAEKNRAMNIQIMFFVALNVVALGTVLTVFKTLPSS
jgi:hypothetical protein